MGEITKRLKATGDVTFTEKNEGYSFDDGIFSGYDSKTRKYDKKTRGLYQ